METEEPNPLAPIFLPETGFEGTAKQYSKHGEAVLSEDRGIFSTRSRCSPQQAFGLPSSVPGYKFLRYFGK